MKGVVNIRQLWQNLKEAKTEYNALHVEKKKVDEQVIELFTGQATKDRKIKQDLKSVKEIKEQLKEEYKDALATAHFHVRLTLFEELEKQQESVSKRCGQSCNYASTVT